MMRRWLASLAVAFVFVCPFAAHATPDGCRLVDGQLTSRAVAGAECQSLIGLCTTGTFTGELSGNISFLGETFSQLPDGWVRYTSAVTLVRPDGTLYGNDVGYIAADGRLVDSINVTNGSGAYAGARGFLLVLGQFDLVGGTGNSRYSGWVCN